LKKENQNLIKSNFISRGDDLNSRFTPLKSIMSKQIIFSEKAQQALKRGVDTIADAVKITIGPRGRNVVLEQSFGAPMITNDGVTISKEITLADKFENMGAEITKEVASKTEDAAGDGTTTSIILMQAIIDEGLKRVSMGANGLNVRHGIEQASKDVVLALEKMAKPIKDKKEIEQVATISAESEEIGRIIAETIEKVGKDGVVTVEESQSFGVESEVVEGMEFDSGYISPYMITNAERMEAEYKNTPILLTDKKISTVKEILPLLEKLTQTGKKDLVIIADDVEGEALATLVVNKLRGNFNVLAIKAPGFGDSKKAQLEDIAVIVGGQVVSEDVGITLEKMELSMLGGVTKIISTKDNTIIVGGKGEKKDINARVTQLKRELELTDSKFDKEKLEERIAKLSGGVAIVRVGAATETEMKYKKLKIEDAVNATKAAIEEGIVLGGGVAFIKAAKEVYDAFYQTELFKKAHQNKKDSEFVIGYSALIDSLQVPLKQIALNAGRDDGSVIVDAVRKSTKDSEGYDAGAQTQGSLPAIDMFEKGIIDPVKVTRTALQNAASAAAILLTTEVAIAEEPKEEKEEGGAGMMPGMM